MFVGVTVYSQPQVFLNASRMSVERYMVNEGDWYLVAADKGLLSYYNKYTKVVVSYSLKNSALELTQSSALWVEKSR